MKLNKKALFKLLFNTADTIAVIGNRKGTKYCCGIVRNPNILKLEKSQRKQNIPQ